MKIKSNVKAGYQGGTHEGSNPLFDH